ncbi:MAG: TRAP transporter large permease [Firmicutes bacterium]|nr:TRAP transporter large permease [Bacillota bacterium]
MNVGALLILMLLGLSILGIPVGFSLGIACIVSLLKGGLPAVVLAQKTFTGIDSVALLAIPFFMLAGNFMSGSCSKKLVAVADCFFGWITGSLAVVCVFASAVFAAISGSGVATVSAIGGILIPSMKEEGYSGGFAAAIASAASILGPIIPPSIFLIVYGNATETSIGALFMGAMIPGFGLAVILAIYAMFYAKSKGIRGHKMKPVKEIAKITLNSIWALFMPILVLGGIFGGIFTATEAAAVTCAYTLFVGLFIYRDIKFSQVLPMCAEAGITAATILLLVGFAKGASWVVVTSGLPQAIIELFLAITESKFVILLLINVLLLIVGMIMEANAAIVMLAPILVPLVKTLGMTTIHFGVIMALNLCIGLITPPVGTCILLGNQIADEKLSGTLKHAMPMIAISIIWLLIVTYVPATVEFLPSLMQN